jgi:hypothetical protein
MTIKECQTFVLVPTFDLWNDLAKVGGGALKKQTALRIPLPLCGDLFEVGGGETRW